VNTAALKSFAPAVRRQLMEAVGRKLDVVLAAQTPDYRTTFARQVEALRKLAHADRQGLIERVAYTWFNRLAALRYLDAKSWHPFRVRVLTPATPEETQPELLRVMRTGALPEELQRYADVVRLNDLLDGRIPSDDAQGEVYRHLVLAACRFYHSLLPDLFERLDDETELLLPDDLLTEHSVAHGFRTQIADEDCGEVELLGWLYQFYISEKKDAVMARKSAVPTEDIPAVTQLFTPHWIVRYLVENSLGRLWLLNRPESRLREQMPYYIEGEAEKDFLRIATPQEIRVIDPAVGSGHMLTYAFDLLYAIYEEEGYAPSEIPALILKHNLYGVDIDPRAAQLASLALVLKAREKSRRFFQRDQLVQPHVIALQDVRFEVTELREYISALQLGELFNQPALDLLRQFEEATTFGALIQPVLGETDIQQLSAQIEARDLGAEIFLSETHHKVLLVLEQAEYLTQRYHVVVANPPYMGSNKFSPSLKSFVGKAFEDGKADLYSCFMLRNMALVVRHGLCAMITLPNWMFLGSWATLRRRLLMEFFVPSLVHNGRGLWGPDFGSCAFVIETAPKPDDYGYFKRLFSTQGEVNTPEELERRYLDNKAWPPYRVNAQRMLKIPEQPIAYWVTETVAEVFRTSKSLSDYGQPRQGFATGLNDRFLRRWVEVAFSNIGFGMSNRAEAQRSGKTWFPCNKGGEFRRWYGNNDLIVDWENDGQRMRAFEGSVLRNQSYYFRAGITWSTLTISRLSMRVSPEGHLFESKGSVCFFEEEWQREYFLGLTNSSVVERLMLALSPTADYHEGPLGRLPVMLGTNGNVERVREGVRKAVALSRSDWDSFETSWDFEKHPLLQPDLKRGTVNASWIAWKAHCDARVKEMQELEAENNRLFIEAYRLENELSPTVPEEQIPLARAHPRRDIVTFISYAVGCMMGRYSLDAPGLVLADAGDTVANYIAKVGKPLEQLTFAPDEDGVIPVLDGEWFEDDIVSRTRDFLRATFGEDTLRENLRFIEESLGKELRKYFLTDFYKDHLQTYRKRPIYWMVQSPRKGFSVLIYLHRYTRDTMNVVLNRYLREYQAKLRDRLAHLARVQADESLGTRDRTAARKEADKLTKVLHECEEWERQTLLPLAQARIELDLDDGVKVNYLKLGEALAPIPGLASREDE
jgi:type II restriction/modification system DNA methylase subunit YeeA